VVLGEWLKKQLNSGTDVHGSEGRPGRVGFCQLSRRS